MGLVYQGLYQQINIRITIINKHKSLRWEAFMLAA